MTEFIRSDATAICDPRQLADQISVAIGKTATCDIDKEKVIVYEDVTGFESQVQATIDVYVWTPPTNPDEELRKAIEAATTLQELKTALLGTNRPAKVAGRPERVCVAENQ